MNKENCRNENSKEENCDKNLEFSKEFCNVKSENRIEKDCDNCKK